MPTKESQNIEFKSEWKDDCLRVISSFANNKGGVLKIGDLVKKDVFKVEGKGKSVFYTL